MNPEKNPNSNNTANVLDSDNSKDINVKKKGSLGHPLKFTIEISSSFDSQDKEDGKDSQLNTCHCVDCKAHTNKQENKSGPKTSVGTNFLLDNNENSVIAFNAKETQADDLQIEKTSSNFTITHKIKIACSPLTKLELQKNNNNNNSKSMCSFCGRRKPQNKCTSNTNLTGKCVCFKPSSILCNCTRKPKLPLQETGLKCTCSNMGIRNTKPRISITNSQRKNCYNELDCVCPKLEKPTSEKPMSEIPTSDQPASEEPTSEIPTSDQPASEEPTSENRLSDKRLTQKRTSFTEPVSVRENLSQDYLSERHCSENVRCKCTRKVQQKNQATEASFTSGYILCSRPTQISTIHNVDIGCQAPLNFRHSNSRSSTNCSCKKNHKPLMKSKQKQKTIEESLKGFAKKMFCVQSSTLVSKPSWQNKCQVVQTPNYFSHTERDQQTPVDFGTNDCCEQTSENGEEYDSSDDIVSNSSNTEKCTKFFIRDDMSYISVDSEKTWSETEIFSHETNENKSCGLSATDISTNTDVRNKFSTKGFLQRTGFKTYRKYRYNEANPTQSGLHVLKKSSIELMTSQTVQTETTPTS